MDGGNREDFAHDSWGGKLEDSRRVVDSALDKGPAPLDSMARGFVQAGESKMVACLIDLALAEGGDRTKELLRKENKHKETALHEAVRVGNNDIVDLLMAKDSELASFPEGGGTSTMYQAIMLKRDEIVKTLYDKSSDGKLSFSGPNGQNALHAAVVRRQGRYTCMHASFVFFPSFFQLNYKLGRFTETCILFACMADWFF